MIKIPVQPALGALAGMAIGALANPDDRLDGALLGIIAGLAVGAMTEQLEGGD